MAVETPDFKRPTSAAGMGSAATGIGSAPTACGTSSGTTCSTNVTGLGYQDHQN